jgi:prepilin signal peptidase PulO-like enzyme (type II secretory pathway)
LSAAIGPWLASGAALVAVALLAALVPARLMREATDGAWTSADGLRVAGVGFCVGLLVLTGLRGMGPAPMAWPPALALASAGVVLTAVAILDAKALVVADLHVVALLALALIGPLAQPWLAALFGAAVGGGLLWGVRWAFARVRDVEGLGLGDVKLMAALGALAGAERVLWIIVAGAVLGLAWARVRRGASDATITVPLAATSALPALAVLLAAPRP